MPDTQLIEDLRVMSPVELIVSKVLSYESRRGKPKSGTDWRDLGMLLNRFPDLKSVKGKISARLSERGASEFAMIFWKQLAEQDFSVEEDDDLSF